MPISNRLRIAAMTAAVAGGAVSGALLAAPAISSAQDATSSTSGTAVTQQAPPQAPSSSSSDASSSTNQQMPSGGPQGQRPDPSQGGHVGQDGTKEELLTGDTATQVTEAAQAAVPDGTVQRVETDAEGATYEAHVQKSDGSQVTVKLDASFAVTSIENGPA